MRTPEFNFVVLLGMLLIVHLPSLSMVQAPWRVYLHDQGIEEVSNKPVLSSTNRLIGLGPLLV
jgi:hypothetical protein